MECPWSVPWREEQVKLPTDSRAAGASVGASGPLIGSWLRTRLASP